MLINYGCEEIRNFDLIYPKHKNRIHYYNENENENENGF